MSILRFVGTVAAAYVAYSILYIGTMMVMFADLYSANAELMRAQDDPLVMYTYVGHLVQTIVVVLLFDKAVGSDDVKAGAIFGGLMGLYLAATDATFYFGLKMSTAPLMTSIILHVLIGVIIGVLLAKTHGVGRGGEGVSEDT